MKNLTTVHGSTGHLTVVSPPLPVMLVKCVSDIHLELRKRIDLNVLFGKTLSIDHDRTILILAGDIGDPFSQLYQTFLQQCADRYMHILVVPGNHEYYTSKTKQRTISEIDQKMDEVCNFNQYSRKNVTLLSTSRSIIISLGQEEFQFIGYTLWTKSDSKAETCLNDYHRIYVNDPEALVKQWK